MMIPTSFPRGPSRSGPWERGCDDPAFLGGGGGGGGGEGGYSMNFGV